MENNLFTAVRTRVSAQDAAEHYGVEVRRGWCKCPFHGERTASLKFYPDGGFYCFGCHRGGSSIDFVSNLFNLKPLEAVKKINTDFSLGLTPGKPPNREEVRKRERAMQTRQAFQTWRETSARILGAAYHEAHKAMQQVEEAGTLDVLTPGQVAALSHREALEDWQDTLVSGKLEEQMEIFKDRRDIVRLCRAIMEDK